MANYRINEVHEITDLRQMLGLSATLYDTETALREKKDGYYQDISYRLFAAEVFALSKIFADRIGAGAHVLLLGRGSISWVRAFLALAVGGLVPVPADTAMSTVDLSALAAASGACAVVYDADSTEAIAALPGLAAVSFSAFPSLVEEGNTLPEDEGSTLTPDTPAAIFYTAGTTGYSKGVVLTHGNIASLLMQVAKMQKIGYGDTFLSVLSPSHIYECVLGLLLPLFCGARIAFAESLSTIMRNMRETHPTYMVTVPYLAEVLLDKFWHLCAASGTETDVRRIIAATDPIRPLAARKALKEKLLAGARAPFGGRLSHMFVVGDFLLPAVQKGLRQIGIAALPGYGITECAGLVAMGREELYRDGSAGLCLPDGVLDIYNPQSDGSGEIRYKGPGVMLGYYNDDAATRRTLRRGWYYTGDIGRFDKDGFLFIIGRKQNCFERADGKIICPEELETMLRQNKLVADCAVVGLPVPIDHDYEIGALIYPDTAYAASLLGEDITDEDMEKLMSQWIRDLNADLPPHKQIALFALSAEPLPRDCSGHLVRKGLAEKLQ